MNGMSIYIEGKEVFAQTIDSDITDKLLGLARSLGEEIAYYTPFDIYLSGDCQGLQEHFTYFNEELPPVDENFYLDNPVNMLLVGSSDNSHDAIYQETIPQLHFSETVPILLMSQRQGLIREQVSISSKISLICSTFQLTPLETVKMISPCF